MFNNHLIKTYKDKKPFECLLQGPKYKVLPFSLLLDLILAVNKPFLSANEDLLFSSLSFLPFAFHAEIFTFGH